MSETLTIGIVIPSYNEGNDLIETLKTVFNQTTPFAEVIVVDDSLDGTDVLVSSTFGNAVRLIHREKPLGRCSARNIGVELSSSDVLIILNADVHLPSNFCEGLKQKYIDVGCDALGVDLIISNTQHCYARYLYAMHLSTKKETLGWTEGFSVRRSSFLKTKGFPDGYPLAILAGEDGEFYFDLQRTGAKICLDFDIKVSTVMPEDPKIIQEQIRGRASLRTWHFIYDKSIAWLIMRSIIKQFYRLLSILTIFPLVTRVIFLWRHYNHGLIDLWNYVKYDTYINWLRTCQEWEDVLRFYNLYQEKGIEFQEILLTSPSQLIPKFTKN